MSEVYRPKNNQKENSSTKGALLDENQNDSSPIVEEIARAIYELQPEWEDGVVKPYERACHIDDTELALAALAVMKERIPSEDEVERVINTAFLTHAGSLDKSVLATQIVALYTKGME